MIVFWCVVSLTLFFLLSVIGLYLKRIVELLEGICEGDLHQIRLYLASIDESNRRKRVLPERFARFE